MPNKDILKEFEEVLVNQWYGGNLTWEETEKKISKLLDKYRDEILCEVLKEMPKEEKKEDADYYLGYNQAVQDLKSKITKLR